MNTEKTKIFSESGQTLIEIVLALSVVVAVITGITFAITSSLTNATFTKNQNLATQYAQQGMEVVRRIRDKSWAAFFSLPIVSGTVNFCLSKNSQKLTVRPGSYCTSDGTKDGIPNVGIFVREIRIQSSNPNCSPGGANVKATVFVAWKDSKCTSPGNPYCHGVMLVSCFTNTNVVPIP